MKKSMFKLVMTALFGISMLTSCGNTEESNNSITTTEFKVYGNCGMCEKTIEGSLNGQDGIDNADWNKESKMISVSYDAKKLDEDKIKSKIADVGYDTDSHKADQSVYDELPACCKYDRPDK